MNKPDSNHLSQQYMLASRPIQVVMPIPLRDWERLKLRIQRCNRSVPPYGSIVLTAVGIAIGALISAVCLLASTNVPNWIHFVCWLVVVSSSGIALTASVFRRFHRAEQTERIELVLEEMEEIGGQIALPMDGEG